MKTAIVYISKHGTTEKVARKIAKNLGLPQTNLLNLRENRNPDTKEYERVIIGGSIHAGMVQKRVKDYCTNNLQTLLQKEVGLFLSAMDEDRYEEEFNNAFPAELRKHAKACAVTGGEFIFEKMNFLEKAIVRKIGKVESTVSLIKEEKIEEFSNSFSKALV